MEEQMFLNPYSASDYKKEIQNFQPALLPKPHPAFGHLLQRDKGKGNVSILERRPGVGH
jgi:hypothetical protein